METPPDRPRSLEQFDLARPRLIRRLRREQAALGYLLAVCQALGHPLTQVLLLATAVALCSSAPELRMYGALLILVVIALALGAASTVAGALVVNREKLAHVIAHLEREHQALTGQRVEPE